ncbi:dihydroorotase, partial [Rhodococcus erythropolis]|nr:dihydroorotase [Rhodococcus erythropolis]
MTRNENGESPVSVLLRGVLIYGEGEPTDVLVGDGTILEIGVDLDPAT